MVPQNEVSNTLKTGKNLTQGEWLLVLDWHHQHKGNKKFSQDVTVAHFRELGWKISQPSLSRSLKREAQIRAEVASVPNAAHSKRPRVVTEPRVDRALFEWQREMESRGEPVTGPMLMAKRGIFEEKLNVPMHERLDSRGWVDSFKKA